MFNSTKISNSPRTKNMDLYSNINETPNGISRSFIQPKITSTPLAKRDSIFATPPKHNILSPKRYSLSVIATSPRSNRRDLTKTVPAGPLLASTRYNVNVSTYEDTKSPGLAGRIVQYNEEAEREREQLRPPTHQAKYGSPGLFPVVHLFKKKLPMLEQKPRRVTIRIASPEYSRRHSQEYNRKLLEGIIKPSSPTMRGSPFSPNNQAGSPRSVLDALKEISRKRIHASEEYDLNEDSGKRLRTMNNGDSNKRLRDDSPFDKSPSPSKPTSKRVCMYDEYAASCSSTDFAFKKAEQAEPKRKSISISTLTDNVNETKQVKLMNAETQTITTETVENKEQTETFMEEERNKTEIRDEPADKQKSPLKIFDDAPLERIRKNRLAALMGSLTGKEPVLLPKPDYASVLNSQAESSDVPDSTAPDLAKSAEKPLVSILSSSRKSSPVKSNKHVHFSVPESTAPTNLDSASVLSFPATPSSTSVLSFPVAPNSAPAAVPMSSTLETNASLDWSSRINRETPAPPSSPVSLQPSSTDSASALPVITFGSGSGSSSATSILSKESSTSSIAMDAPKTGFSMPNFQFKPATVSPASIVTTNSTPVAQLTFSSSTPATNPAIAASPPKMGGFKFDLSKPVTTSSTAATISIPTFSLGGAPQLGANKTSSAFTSAVIPSSSTQKSMPATFNFGAKATAPATTDSSSFPTSLSFGTTISSSTFSTPAVTASFAPTFAFGSAGNENKTATSAVLPLTHSNATFGVISTTTSAPAFGTNTSSFSSTAAVVAVPTFNTTKAQFFSFGASKTTSATSGFGVPTSTTSSPITFGAPSSTSSNFGTPTSSFLNTSTPMPASGFGVATTSSTVSGGFGSPSTTVNTGFGSTATPMFGASKAVSPFAVNTSTTSGFGMPTTNPPPFGKSGTPQFGQTATQASFGTPTTTAAFVPSNTFGATTTTTSSSVFGAANNSPSVFGAKTSGFGTPPTNASIFGGPVNTQPSNFGTPASKPMFGSTTTAPFGTSTNTTAAPSFGSNTTPAFNFSAKTTASLSFGGGNSFGATTTASTGFGSTTTPTFGAANSFGGTSNFGTNNTFGGSAAPAFGATTTTAQPGGFGAATTTQPGGFGATTTAQPGGFGATTTTQPGGFGAATTTQPGGFGATTTSSFGTANSGFSAGDKNSMFGNPQAVPMFGNNSSVPFGTSTSTSTFGTTGGTPGFGTNTAPSAFTKPQTTQNPFGAPTTNTFGTNNSFGSAQPQTASFRPTNPPNAQNAVFSFGAAVPPKPPGVFSFGVGASNEVPKPNFNFTGGGAAPPAFGSGGTPSFGNNAPPPFGTSGIPQFNAPQTGAQGMFSIGSGSTTGKARTHLKPKRRT